MPHVCLSGFHPLDPHADNQVQEAVKELQQQFGKNRVVVRLPAGAGAAHMYGFLVCTQSLVQQEQA